MKFITHNKYTKNGGVDYAAFRREELARFSVTRLKDGKEAFANRRIRRDSKYWNSDYMVWDLRENCLA